jgi:hypothetical protein
VLDTTDSAAEHGAGIKTEWAGDCRSMEIRTGTSETDAAEQNKIVASEMASAAKQNHDGLSRKEKISQL